ncbi:SMI1/KNR4 family protein [Nocardia sp. NPDC059240]|uniref:SMI1/KNR4 family protein n=1 Tax=Nocardia sp. NPDC059240 TaxID=3346786 RepID=UPI00368750D7
MDNVTDWPAMIGYLLIVKNEIDQRDLEKLQEYTAPRQKVSEEVLRGAESSLNVQFPVEYRNFLLHADGWKSFYWNTDLFGMLEFSGEGAAHVATEGLGVYEAEGVLEDLKLEGHDLIPIGAGIGSENLFLLVVSGDAEKVGTVIWIDGGDEIETFRGFDEFFAAIIEEHKSYLEEL